MIQSIFGLFTILLIPYLLSENKRTIAFTAVGTALILHFILAIIFLKIPVSKEIFLLLNQVVLALDRATTAGTTFVFGYLGGGPLPFAVNNPAATFILGIKALPIVLVISALSALLYYYRILPVIVGAFSYLLQKSLNIGGAVGLSVAANAFVGMVEAPLLIKPYLSKMTRGEIFSMMVAGMSTIAGTVMVLYANLLTASVPGAMGHILTASILNVFSSLIISLLLIPHQTMSSSETVHLAQMAKGPMDAIVKGTADGLKLLANIIALLIVLVALVNLINQLLYLLPTEKPTTLQGILGVLMAPLTFLIGIPFAEILTTGALMGTKIVLNELIAYVDLANLPPDTLQERSRIIMVYALCGFANMGSLGIMIGGLTVMVPEKREEIIAMGMKSILAGVLATCLTANIIGIII